MWSIGMRVSCGVQTAFAATSSFPPRLFGELQNIVDELRTHASGDLLDDSFSQRVESALAVVKQIEEAKLLPVGSSRPETLRLLLLNKGSFQDGLRRLNYIIRNFGGPTSSIPAVSNDAAEQQRREFPQRRPSWPDEFRLILKQDGEKIAAGVKRPLGQQRAQRQMISSLGEQLWKQQWPPSQKESVREDAPVVQEEIIATNNIQVAHYSKALAISNLAAETALAILYDDEKKHLLANVSEAMPQDQLNEAIRTEFPFLTLTRIYVMTGTALGLSSSVKVLSAIHAAGVTKLESSIKLLRPPTKGHFPGLMLHGGQIYDKST